MRTRLVSETEFDQLKELQLAGATVEWTRKETNRSWHTIDRLFKCESYAEFSKAYKTQSTPAHTELEAMVVREESRTVQDLRKAQAKLNQQFEDVIATMLKIEGGI